PPHFGLTNTRLTVHLPLIVPDDCQIRVGADHYNWRQGQVVAFDDSYEHEAWNRSGSDRVVLIFECHHPDLTPAERSAIEYGYAARQQWLDQRMQLLHTLLPAAD
ncbi:MAG: aspartyl/asparaginyl beta-hydroxylase domain-containing protein, partial [Gammaproteobacteria bacterium]|nr:aspartyl/asparaginyl beta-hydroxylase domain-containing protein [Gammaproteobacteria bacterium]